MKKYPSSLPINYERPEVLAMDQIILELKNVCKQFANAAALSNVSLVLKRGEIHALLGENGAGKTTLMKVLTGAIPMDSGEIYMDGKRVTISSPADAQKLGISMVYQDFSLFPHLTVAENIFIGNKPMIKGSVDLINWRALFCKAKALLEQLGFPIDPRAIVEDLNMPKRQMVEIARALAQQPRILIMDEPTSALAEQEIMQLFSVLKNIVSQRGASIIYVTHRLEEIWMIADSVSVMRDGTLISTEAVNATDPDSLIFQMIGKDVKDKYPKLPIKKGAEVFRVKDLSVKDQLSDISFVLHEGEILGIAGFLGSGRSTLAKALFGAESISTGEIFVDQQKVRISSPKEAIENGIALLSEDRLEQGLFPYMSISANMVAANLHQFTKDLMINKHKEDKLANMYIKKLGIKTPKSREAVSKLSSGNQQKVLIAKWMLAKARVFILDEPTRGLDIGSKVEVYNLMNELARSGSGIIMISPELPELLGMCDRLLVLHKGRIAKELARHEASQELVFHYASGK